MNPTILLSFFEWRALYLIPKYLSSSEFVYYIRKMPMRSGNSPYASIMQLYSFITVLGAPNIRDGRTRKTDFIVHPLREASRKYSRASPPDIPLS